MNRAESEIAHVSPNLQRQALRMLVGGMLCMMVAMGIGRFAFTPILPLMQRDLGISHGLAGSLVILEGVLVATDKGFSG